MHVMDGAEAWAGGDRVEKTTYVTSINIMK